MGSQPPYSQIQIAQHLLYQMEQQQQLISYLTVSLHISHEAIQTAQVATRVSDQRQGQQPSIGRPPIGRVSQR